jgi:hypothetical protein
VRSSHRPHDGADVIDPKWAPNYCALVTVTVPAVSPAAVALTVTVPDVVVARTMARAFPLKAFRLVAR